MDRRTLIAAGLAAALPARAPRAQGTALRLGLAPYLSPAALLALFRPVVEHLQRQLGRPVETYTARDFQALAAAVRGGEYDLALVPAHLGRVALADWRWLPVARTIVATPVLVVVRGAGPVQTAADLRGRRVGTLDLLSLTSAVGARWLAQQQLPESLVTPMPSVNSALIALERDELGAVVATESQMRSLPPTTPGGQRTLARIDDVPGPVYVARPGTPPEVLARLRDALGSVVPDASRPHTAANSRPVPLAAADLDGIEPYAAYLRAQLAGR